MSNVGLVSEGDYRTAALRTMHREQWDRIVRYARGCAVDRLIRANRAAANAAVEKSRGLSGAAWSRNADEITRLADEIPRLFAEWDELMDVAYPSTSGGGGVPDE